MYFPAKQGIVPLLFLLLSPFLKDSLLQLPFPQNPYFLFCNSDAPHLLTVGMMNYLLYLSLLFHIFPDASVRPLHLQCSHPDFCSPFLLLLLLHNDCRRTLPSHMQYSFSYKYIQPSEIRHHSDLSAIDRGHTLHLSSLRSTDSSRKAKFSALCFQDDPM